METAGRVARWIERELDREHPERLTLTFFGGEPLLNLPVMYDLAERAWAATQARGIKMSITIITNGLLLTPDVVDRLTPYGLSGIKITLDGDRDTHNRMRPLRGGQGTFDRIVENVRHVADRVPIAIGGNFDESSVDSYPALLDFLKEQEFADKLIKVAFKPIVRNKVVTPKGVLPLIPVGANGKPLNGTCMTAAGAGGGSVCDSCNFNDEARCFCARKRSGTGSRRPTACTWARARFIGNIPTRSDPTDRSTPARGSPASRRCRPATSTGGRSPGARRRAVGSTTWARGRTAETAPSSPCVPGDVRWHRTRSLAT